MSDRLFVETRLARAIEGTVLLREFDVMRDLVGDRYWSIVSVALGGPRLDAAACELVDVLTTLVAIGDPRIWPLKITRLVGSYGNPSCAMAAGYCVVDGAIFGPHPARSVAQFFVNATRGNDRATHKARVREALDAAMSRKDRVAGFGVAGRDEDERNVALAKYRSQNDIPAGPYWEVYEDACAHMLDAYGLYPNFIGPIAIIGLDLGLKPDQIAAFASIQFHWAFLANGFEATRESPEILRRLPDEFVRYKGPAPRRSPRAIAADE